jgi:hypothetical protein
MDDLFWLVFKRKDDVAVFIQPANDIITARMRAMIAGVEAEFQEGHRLDTKMVGKIPTSSIGRVLNAGEARSLLKRLG